MAIQSPFFGKRDIDNATGLRQAVPNAPATRTPGTVGSQSGALHGNTAQQPSTTEIHGATATPTTSSSSSAAVAAAPAPASGREGGSKLTVGPNIKLKGVEITDCDTLVVEGTVEATMDSRLMQIAECGAFKGSAEIDIAEIHGAFDGNLTVREKLVIHATGRVTGTVRYGKLVVEEGGQLSGEILVGATQGVPSGRAAPTPKVDLQAA